MINPSNEIHQNYLDTFYRCITEKGKMCHDMVEDHKLVYIMSGRLTLQAGKHRVTVKNGEAVFVRRNHLVHETKEPSPDGAPFKGLFFHLKTPLLRKIAAGIKLPKVHMNAQLNSELQIPLPPHPFLTGLFLSLDSYFSSNATISEELIETKTKETVLILLQLKPELASILFDFRNEWKTDLRDFMLRHYLSALSLEQFAYYSGRSLSGFKRDFSEIFHESPHKWIMEKKLERAYSLLSDSNASVGEVYMKTGFKNPSHFATAFKRRYGCTPSEVYAGRR